MSMGATEQETEFTEREKAIMRGETPPDDGADTEVGDAGTDAPLETPVGEGEEAAGQGGVGTQGGKEAATAAVSEQGGSWIDDEAVELAESYGVSKEELSEFPSAAEFRRFTRGVDRLLIKQGKPEAVPDKPEETAKTEEEIDLDPSKYEGYDDETQAIVKFARAQKDEVKALKQAVQSMLNERADERQQVYLNLFHDAVDQLDEKRYGRSLDAEGNPISLDEKQDAARRKIHEQVDELMAGIAARAERLGKKPQFPSMGVLLKRAERLVYGDEIAAEEQRRGAEKLRSQAKQVRPSPNRQTAKAAPRLEGTDEARRLADDPAIAKVWNKFQEENGAR